MSSSLVSKGVRSKKDLESVLHDLTEKNIIYNYLTFHDLSSDFAKVVIKFNKDYWVDFIVRIRNFDENN